MSGLPAEIYEDCARALLHCPRENTRISLRRLRSCIDDEEAFRAAVELAYAAGRRDAGAELAAARSGPSPLARKSLPIEATWGANAVRVEDGTAGGAS